MAGNVASGTTGSSRAEGFNPLDPEFFSNPYPAFDRLRSQDPVHENPLGFWLLTRYDDVVATLRNPSCSRDVSQNAAEAEERRQKVASFNSEVIEILSEHQLLSLDPPAHTRLRGLVAKAFTPKAVSDLAPAVAGHVQDHLAALAGQASFDVIADLAFPVPFTTISQLLGMPLDETEAMRGWSQDLTRILEWLNTPEQIAAAGEAAEQMGRRVRDTIQVRRQHPADDLISGLIRAQDGGDSLDDDELLGIVLMLYIGGHETTVNLIGTAVHALLTHPDQLARFQADPTLEDGAVEEFLRYDCPIQLAGRVTTAELVFEGGTIPPGQVVLLGLGAANHDPARFDDPHRLWLDRPDAGKNTAFGGGIHYCLGAGLAKLEVGLVLSHLLASTPELRLDGEPRWRDTLALRGLAALPVTTEAAR